MPDLPPADWTRRPALLAVVEALGQGNVRWVGGAVRDTLLGHDAHDIDAATPLTPGVVTDRLEAHGIRAIPTGLAHGTVTALVAGGNVEITTLRKDISTDGRRAEVEFTSDWHADAARRDFTINALYADPLTLEIFDYFGGVEDLAARRVRFIGDPRERIREDHLRILRYFRFQTRFGAKLDPAAEEACAELAPTLKGLSRERVGWELQALLALPDPSATIVRMQALGVLQVILPEAGRREADKLAELVTAERAAKIAPHPMRRLAALLPPVATVAEAVAARLRLSKNQRTRLVCAAARDPRDAENPRALAYTVGHSCAIDRLLLCGAPVDTVADWLVPIFPLKGGTIVARGIAAGPAVARILQSVERDWIAAGFPDGDAVSALLDQALLREK